MLFECCMFFGFLRFGGVLKGFLTLNDGFYMFLLDILYRNYDRMLQIYYIKHSRNVKKILHFMSKNVYKMGSLRLLGN